MALVKCKECGEKISKKAASCPHCGAGTKKTSSFTWFVTIFMVFMMYSCFSTIDGSRVSHKSQPTASSKSTLPETPTSIAIDKSPEAQKKRLALIRELQMKGVIGKIEADNGYPHVYIKPAFYVTDIDTKQAVLSMIFAYYHTQDEAIDFIFLNDSQSGRRSGNYSPVFGLDMD